MPTNDTMIASFNEALQNFREHLCEMQMAYEDMDGAVRIHPWAQEFADKYLHALAQQFTNPTNPTNQPIQQHSIMNITVNGTANIFEAGTTNNLVFNIAHTDSVSSASIPSDHAELTQEGEFTQKSTQKGQSPLCKFPPHSIPSEHAGGSDHTDISDQEGRPELPEESKVDSLTREVERLKGCLTALQLPRENSYVELVDWLEREKQEGRDWYREADYNRSQMARNLSDYLGWVVDYTTLSRAINRR